MQIEANSIDRSGFIEIGMPILPLRNQIDSYNDLCGMEMIDSEVQIGTIIKFLMDKIGTWLPTASSAFGSQDSWAHSGTAELFDTHSIIIQPELLYSLYLFIHTHMIFSVNSLSLPALSWSYTSIKIIGTMCIVRIRYRVVRFI